MSDGNLLDGDELCTFRERLEFWVTTWGGVMVKGDFAEMNQQRTIIY